MTVGFTGDVWYWKGPAPHYFVTVPAPHCDDLKTVSGLVTYGWVIIPVSFSICKSEWTTSLFPKNGSYILPLKASVRKAEAIDEGDTVTVQLTVDVVVS